MDDLTIFLIALLRNDVVLKDLFQAAMEPADWSVEQVNVVHEDERTTACYPRIVISGDEGSQMSFGDDAPPLFLDGRVRLEIVTLQTSRCREPLGTLRAIQARVADLLLGNAYLALPSVKGQIVSPEGTPQPFRVTVWKQINPTRMLPTVDPINKRHLTTYAVQLYRLYQP